MRRFERTMRGRTGLQGGGLNETLRGWRESGEVGDELRSRLVDLGLF
jgi:hypothetical protein